MFPRNHPEEVQIQAESSNATSDKEFEPQVSMEPDSQFSPCNKENYQLVTVWSAPNYCYRCGNVASILGFDSELIRSERVFEATKENENMMAPRTAMRYFM